MNILETIQKETHGFIIDNTQLEKLGEEFPKQKVLVRCGNIRFTCQANSALSLINAYVAFGADYVRDISIYKAKDYEIKR